MSGPWLRYPAVYEINTRVWLSELSAAAGRPLTLAEVPDEALGCIAEKGFAAVWLMGVWTTGPVPIALSRSLPGQQEEYVRALPDVTPADVIGSPYAVTRYEVSPGLGGPEALAALRRRLAGHGLRLLLDFVCNHTATDCPLLQEPGTYVEGTEEDLSREPDGYFRAPGGAIIAHGRDPYFPAWRDTAAVNYSQPPGRRAMLADLRGIAAQCDGVRCDMAMLILPDVRERIFGARLGPDPDRTSFWTEAIPAIRAEFPHFLFLAEAYWGLEALLQVQGFDFTYDKELYDALLRDDRAEIRRRLRDDRAHQDHMARFLENHDERRAVVAFGPARARCAAALSLCAPGMKLLHEGQLQGHRVKLPVQLGRRPAEPTDTDTAAFYDRLLGALRDPAFREGAYAVPDVLPAGPGDHSHDALCALSWLAEGPGKRPGYLVVANLAGHDAYGRVPLPADRFAAGRSYLFIDHLDGARYEREGAELLSPGLFIDLAGHQVHLFEIVAAQ